MVGKFGLEAESTVPCEPMPAPEPWDNWNNAEIYREYVENFPIYRALNRRLVELASLDDARRVLDLGCGTGATTSACLEELPKDAEVEGVDAAATMVEAARASVADPRARFRHAYAGSVDEVVDGHFDRVVCNAAFARFPNPTSVLRALGRVVTPGGRFVFNAPHELLAGDRAEPEPFQISLGQAVSERTGSRPSPRRVDVAAVERALTCNGFRLHARYLFRYRGRQGELMELMKVPALAAELAPELDYDACLEIVHRAAERNDPNMEVTIPWTYFVAVK